MEHAYNIFIFGLAIWSYNIFRTSESPARKSQIKSRTLRRARDWTRPDRNPGRRWLSGSRTRAGSRRPARRPQRRPAGWTDGERTVGDATASDGDGGDCGCAWDRRRRSSCGPASCFPAIRCRRLPRLRHRRHHTVAAAGGVVACSSGLVPTATCCCSPLPVVPTFWSLENEQKNATETLMTNIFYCFF